MPYLNQILHYVFLPSPRPTWPPLPRRSYVPFLPYYPRVFPIRQVGSLSMIPYWYNLQSWFRTFWQWYSFHVPALQSDLTLRGVCVQYVSMYIYGVGV